MQHALLKVARKLLATEGLGKLSTRRIAQQAGTSTTAIYSLFGGKDGLMEALYLDGFDRLEAALQAFPEDDADHPVQRIVTLNRQYRVFALEYPQDYAVMFERGIPDFQPSSVARLRAWQSLRPLIQRIQEAQRSGFLLHQSPEALAMTLWVASHGIVSLELAGYFPERLEAQAMHDRMLRDLLDPDRTLGTLP
ncbi:WHG domain-containing protein [Deinococcus sp. Arct2-2]|uniref:TetR/AcrR family transcriptional regulator n=1 Tax=Deinococcus sp. Arct2-2 TaxID=2568653 RepID=UPI001454BC8B|nr:WHG domain-containing protein [Deinococcus sp. Arct2-2]